MTEDFYKERSFSACIKAAYELLYANFATITRKTWKASLVLAVCMGAVSATFSHITRMPTAMAVIVVLALSAFSTAVYVIAGGCFDATYLSIANKQPTAANVKRGLVLRATGIVLCAAATAIVLAVSVATAVMLAKGKDTPAAIANYAMLASAATAVILCLAAVPFFFSMTKYAVEPNSRAADIFGRWLATGYRNYGMVFATLILSGLIATIIMAVAASPTLMLMKAEATNQASMLLGDADAMPRYTEWLLLASVTVLEFVGNITTIWMFLVGCYTYGSITSKTRQSLQNNDTTND